MADNSLLPRSYMAPPYSGNFGYPNLETALAETDDQARVAMYGPREGMLANLHAEADRAAIQEGRDAVAREEAQPGQVANFLAYQTPVVGNALAARDAVESAGNRDWLGFGLNALGAAPLVGMFAGPLAKTANLARMNRAAAMASSGHSAEDIWRETGWFRGAEGKWRHEIDDSTAGLKPREANFLLNHPHEQRVTPMNYGFEHPELYAAYADTAPFSGRYVAAYTPTKNLSGGYSPINDSITVSGPMLKDIRSVSLHELQHAVAKREGFAAGGNYDALGRDIYRRLAGEVEARNVQTRMNMSLTERMLTLPQTTEDVPRELQIVRRQ